MGNKKYIFAGSILAGVAVYLLYDRLKKGGIRLNMTGGNSADPVANNSSSTVNLDPPMKVPSLATPTLV